MENFFNSPTEVIETNIKGGEKKVSLPLGKMIVLGIMAGAFIALGGATSSTAAGTIFSTTRPARVSGETSHRSCTARAAPGERST